MHELQNAFPLPRHQRPAEFWLSAVRKFGVHLRECPLKFQEMAPFGKSPSSADQVRKWMTGLTCDDDYIFSIFQYLPCLTMSNDHVQKGKTFRFLLNTSTFSGIAQVKRLFMKFRGYPRPITGNDVGGARTLFWMQPPPSGRRRPSSSIKRCTFRMQQFCKFALEEKRKVASNRSSWPVPDLKSPMCSRTTLSSWQMEKSCLWNPSTFNPGLTEFWCWAAHFKMWAFSDRIY